MPAVPEIVPPTAAAAAPAVTAAPSGFVKFAKDSFAGTVGERLASASASATRLQSSRSAECNGQHRRRSAGRWGTHRRADRAPRLTHWLAGGIAVTMVGHPFGEWQLRLRW